MFFHHLPDFQKVSTDIPHTIFEFLQEPILFHHTKSKSVEETVISRQVWSRLGFGTIGQLTSENFEFLEYSRLTTKFGNHINFLEYHNGMICCLGTHVCPSRVQAK